MLFYPFTVLRFLSPLESPWLYFDLFHCAVAASGIYLLASRWTGNRWLALALSLAILPFATGGFLSANRMAALAWTPWMLLLAEPAFTRGGRDLVLCGGLAAIQLLTGSAEVVALTWICVALMSVGRTVPVSRLARSAWLPVKRLAAFALLAFLLAATQVVPLLDALPVLEKSRPSIDVDVEYFDPQGHCLA